MSDFEKEILEDNIKGHPLKVFIWEEKSNNISDSEELKLVILSRRDDGLMSNILKNKGKTPRVYVNTLVFLCPLESERGAFAEALRRRLGFEYIKKDGNLRLTSDQEQEVLREIKKADSELNEYIRRLYRLIILPGKEGLKELDLGIPTYGEEKDIDQDVYETLRAEGEILEKIAPLVIREKYLSGKTYCPTNQIYQSSFRTPGETRVLNKNVFEEGIIEGVYKGLFGLGELEKDEPICRYFKEKPTVSFSDKEVIIDEKICKEEQESKKEPVSSGSLEDASGQEIEIDTDNITTTPEPSKALTIVHLKFNLPKGKVSGIMGVMHLLQSKFEKLNVEITAEEGAISEQDYEDKIKETFRQLGIEVEE